MTFSVRSCSNTLPSRRLIVAAFELDVMLVASSIVPLSKLTTPLASEVTIPEACVSPSVSGSFTVYVAAALCAGPCTVTP